jgi:UDPglucose 6-dehydrogenase
MKIGVVGLGVVGGAAYEGFKLLEHEMFKHDIRLDTKIDDLLETDVCFVCVPTPSQDSGDCDTSIVESVVEELHNINYQGIVAIKSTVTPGTTNKLSEKYPEMELCFVPEFLRERCAVEDFIHNHDLCVVGTNDPEVFDLIKKCHGHYPEKFVYMPTMEAEFVKYFNNTYNATLVTFANSFYEICTRMGADYNKIKDTIVNRDHINDVYLNCNENFRGFGGPCLPKDTRTMAFLEKRLDSNVDFFGSILKENSKYKVTIHDGMREE